MEALSWESVFNPFENKGLKELRTEGNLNIPKAYIVSSKRLMLVFGYYSCLIGMVLGAVIFKLVVKL